MRMFLLVPAISLVLSVAVAAQQKVQDEQITNKKESAATEVSTSSETQILLDELIDELGSLRFAIRLQAARKLAAAGEQAIETLRRVTKTGTKETASQALKILQEHLENKNNNALQIAAKKALEQISADDKNPNSSAAKGILNNEANAQSTQNPQVRRFPMILPGNLRAAAMRVQVQNNNGKIRIQVEKNGQKTSITEDKDGIKVERKDVKGKVTKKTYKNADEMKLKDKDAYQTFQQYKKVGGGIQIQFKGNGIPLQFKAQPKKLPNLNPGAPKGDAPQNLEKMQRQTLKQHRDMMESQLRKMQENIENNVPKEHRKQLEDLLKKQREIMNRPLLELEQKLKQRTPADGESGVPLESPAPAGKKPADKKPIQVEAVEQELLET
ncbi:MAG: hypothetical protein CMM01_05855 [Rhodopirellula sp.]|nr:hypothetical protein [Rhodopirellula sp.]OUX52118.1 MAG: hypothetical protein CBE43_01415 [Rhodopirellula sp. TMED283]